MQTTSSNFEEIKLLSDTYTKFWAMYINWFTWFFGINVAAMAFLVTNYKSTSDKYLIWALCIFMAVCVGFGIVASIKMISYGREAAVRGEILRKALFEETKSELDFAMIMGKTIAKPTSWLLFGSVIWIFCAWVFMAAWVAGIIPHIATQLSN